MGLKANTKQDLYKIFHFKNGLYQGEMSYREKSGFGVFAWDTGEFYYGLWSKNRMNGRGIMFLPNEIVIKGVFRNDSLHGKAYIMMGGKTMLICEYVSGNCIGEVIKVSLDESVEQYLAYNLRTGRQFFGLVKGDLPFGMGLFIYPDLKYHSGYYENGLLEGLSRINFGNGDIFEGESVKGKMNGHGFYYNAEKNEWVFGLFLDDECTEVIENGEGFPLNDIEKFRFLKHQEFQNFIDSETERIKINLEELIKLSSIDDQVFLTINSEEAIPSSVETKKENFSKFEKDSILSPSEIELSPGNNAGNHKKTLHEFYREANLMKKKKRRRRRKKKIDHRRDNCDSKSEMMAKTDYFTQSKSESFGGFRKTRNFNYSMYEEPNTAFEKKAGPELISPSTNKSKKTIKKKRKRNKNSNSKRPSGNQIIKGKKILRPKNRFLSPENYSRYLKKKDLFYVESNSKADYTEEKYSYITNSERGCQSEIYKHQSVQTDDNKTLEISTNSPQNVSTSDQTVSQIYIQGIQSVASMVEELKILVSESLRKNSRNHEENEVIKERIKILNKKIYDIVEPGSDDDNPDSYNFFVGNLTQNNQNDTPPDVLRGINDDLNGDSGFVNEPMTLEPILEETEMKTSRVEEDNDNEAMRRDLKSIGQENSASKSNYDGPFNSQNEEFNTGEFAQRFNDVMQNQGRDEDADNFKFFTSRYNSNDGSNPKNSPNKEEEEPKKLNNVSPHKFSFRNRELTDRSKKVNSDREMSPLQNKKGNYKHLPKNVNVKLISKKTSKALLEENYVNESIQTLEISPDNLSPVKNSDYELSLNKPSYERLTYTNTIFSQLDDQNRLKSIVSPQSNHVPFSGSFQEKNDGRKSQKFQSFRGENLTDLHSFRAKSQDNMTENKDPNLESKKNKISNFSETENLTNKLKQISQKDSEPESPKQSSRGKNEQLSNQKSSKEEIVKYIISQQYHSNDTQNNSNPPPLPPGKVLITSGSIDKKNHISVSNLSNKSSEIDFTSKELIHDFIVARSNTKFIKIVNDYENIPDKMEMMSPTNLPAVPLNSTETTNKSQNKLLSISQPSLNSKNPQKISGGKNQETDTPIAQSLYNSKVPEYLGINFEEEHPMVSNYSSTPITRVTSSKDITNMQRIAEEIGKMQRLTPQVNANLNTSKSGIFVDCFGVLREFGIDYNVNPFLYPVNQTGFVYVDYN